MSKCAKTFSRYYVASISSIITLTSSFVLLTVSSVASANLIRNPSFEDVPNNNTGQGIMPSEWVIANSTPDTYSNDASYGLHPDANGNFSGVTAFDGIRFVAGWSLATERFGQMLSAPLVPGQEYEFSAYMHQALRLDLNNPGAYYLFLQDTAVGASESVFIGSIGSTLPGDWQFFSMLFTAPGNADSLPFLMFSPVATVREGTYPGLDLVSLTSTVPLPAAVWLFGAGLIGLVGLARRRRKKT